MTVRKNCCITVSKGIHLIACLSFIFGGIIVVGNCYLIYKTNLFMYDDNVDYLEEISTADNEEGNVNTLNSHSAGAGDLFPNKKEVYKFIYPYQPWSFLIGVSQLISSLLLIFFKSKRSLQFWVFVQLLGIIYFLWNLPSVSPIENFPNKFLFGFVSFNFCSMIFMVLVILEFLVHPANYQDFQSQYSWNKCNNGNGNQDGPNSI